MCLAMHGTQEVALLFLAAVLAVDASEGEAVSWDMLDGKTVVEECAE